MGEEGGGPIALAQHVPSLKAEVIAIVEKAMACSAQDRYQTFTAMEKDLDRVLEKFS